MTFDCCRAQTPRGRVESGPSPRRRTIVSILFDNGSPRGVFPICLFARFNRNERKSTDHSRPGAAFKESFNGNRRHSNGAGGRKLDSEFFFFPSVLLILQFPRRLSRHRSGLETFIYFYRPNRVLKRLLILRLEKAAPFRSVRHPICLTGQSCGRGLLNGCGASADEGEEAGMLGVAAM